MQRMTMSSRSPSDLIVPGSRADARAKASSQHAEPYESLGLRRDGSTFPIESHSHTVFYQGRRMRVAVIRDLTRQKAAEAALRESEARLRELLATVDLGAFIARPGRHHPPLVGGLRTSLWLDRGGGGGTPLS